jgi:excisionase family DNA binding protein
VSGKGSDVFESFIFNNIRDYRVMKNMRDNLNSSESLDQNGCSVCKELLAHMQRFFEVLESARRASTSDWLTVEEIAEELRISKNVVYRLIRNGELEAINIVDTNGRVAQRGHYRINRADLQKYISTKRAKTFPIRSARGSRSRQFPKVRNHLGL